jgi:hypothetical protein
MRVGQILTVNSNWSVTGETCRVEVINWDWDKMTLYIQYPSGYSEWLPVAAFMEF